MLSNSSTVSAKSEKSEDRNKKNKEYLTVTTPLLENVVALQAALPGNDELMRLLKKTVTRSVFEAFVNSCEVHVVLHGLRLLSVWFTQEKLLLDTSGKTNTIKHSLYQTKPKSYPLAKLITDYSLYCVMLAILMRGNDFVTTILNDPSEWNTVFEEGPSKNKAKKMLLHKPGFRRSLEYWRKTISSKVELEKGAKWVDLFSKQMIELLIIKHSSDPNPIVKKVIIFAAKEAREGIAQASGGTDLAPPGGEGGLDTDTVLGNIREDKFGELVKVSTNNRRAALASLLNEVNMNNIAIQSKGAATALAATKVEQEKVENNDDNDDEEKKKKMKPAPKKKSVPKKKSAPKKKPTPKMTKKEKKEVKEKEPSKAELGKIIEEVIYKEVDSDFDEKMALDLQEKAFDLEDMSVVEEEEKKQNDAPPVGRRSRSGSRRIIDIDEDPMDDNCSEDKAVDVDPVEKTKKKGSKKDCTNGDGKKKGDLECPSLKRGGEKNKTAQKLALWKRCDDIPCCLRSLGTDSTGIWDKGSAICRQVVEAKKKKGKKEKAKTSGENVVGEVDGGDANSDLGGKNGNPAYRRVENVKADTLKSSIVTRDQDEAVVAQIIDVLSTSSLFSNSPPASSTSGPASSKISVVVPCGLVNQGATCYLNSLLQCLYQNVPFRAGVYQFKNNEGGDEKVRLDKKRKINREEKQTDDIDKVYIRAH
ncbi:hypothetical protein TrCOL_g1982 [Triparma columacea]|uniref:ubiquitinyl hydrolase 1 n=1 Tax=Triparma columacea TaxID=722753 RepID=A0A9W7G3F2_9STRA|nr:hypothetical protein TrCOL_g1982 [Triparma columacea]